VNVEEEVKKEEALLASSLSIPEEGSSPFLLPSPFPSSHFPPSSFSFLFLLSLPFHSETEVQTQARQGAKEQTEEKAFDPVSLETSLQKEEQEQGSSQEGFEAGFRTPEAGPSPHVSRARDETSLPQVSKPSAEQKELEEEEGGNEPSSSELLARAEQSARTAKRRGLDHEEQKIGQRTEQDQVVSSLPGRLKEEKDQHSQHNEEREGNSAPETQRSFGASSHPPASYKSEPVVPILSTVRSSNPTTIASEVGKIPQPKLSSSVRNRKDPNEQSRSSR